MAALSKRMSRVAATATVAFAIGLAAGVGHAQPQQRSQGACRGPLTFGPLSWCDRAHHVLCTAAFGLYIRDAEAEQRQCDAVAQLEQMLADFRARYRNDADKIQNDYIFNSMQVVVSRMRDPTVPIWVVSVNVSDAPADFTLQRLVSPMSVGPMGAAGSTYSQVSRPPDPAPEYRAYLVSLLSGAAPGQPQPPHAWHAVQIEVPPHQAAATAVTFGADGAMYGVPYGFAIGLFKETAPDHRAVLAEDVLAAGLYPFYAGLPRNLPQSAFKRGPGR